MTTGLAFNFVLVGFAAAGLVALLVQLFFVWRFSRRTPKKSTQHLGISILKPLCGVDDDLVENLRQFATLDYPNYELVLGVKNEKDPAYAVAQDAVRKWPQRVRLVLQRGEPGLNPKVNQLITLEAAARHDIVLVSDSNVRVPPGYLDEIAAQFEDPKVACVTNPIVGIGEIRFGSLLDNFHLGTSIGPGMVAAKLSSGKDIVVGKSMALRRDALRELGGFYAARNHLAEDYVLGKKVVEQLGMKVAMCRLPVYNVSQKRGIKEFFNRYMRWSVIHRTAIAPYTYAGQGMLIPVAWALLAVLLRPSWLFAAAFLLIWAAKVVIDVTTLKFLRERAFGWWRTPLAVLTKDLLIFIAWLNGIFDRTVVWRGNKLRVHHGSLLIPDGAALATLDAGVEPRPVEAAALAAPDTDANRFVA